MMIKLSSICLAITIVSCTASMQHADRHQRTGLLIFAINSGCIVSGGKTSGDTTGITLTGDVCTLTVEQDRWTTVIDSKDLFSDDLSVVRLKSSILRKVCDERLDGALLDNDVSISFNINNSYIALFIANADDPDSWIVVSGTLDESMASLDGELTVSGRK